MRIVDLAAIPNRTVDRFASRAARHAGIADIASGSAVSVIHLGPDGRLGRHPAAVPQLMVVTGGSGYASGDDARISTLTLADGEAAIAKPYRDADVVRALAIVREIVTAGTATPPFPSGFRLLPEVSTRLAQALPA